MILVAGQRMSRNIRYIIIGLLVIGLLGLLYMNINTGRKVEKLEKDIKHTVVPKKQELVRKMNQEEVKELKQVTEEKMNDFLIGDYRDDKSGDGSAYDVMRGLFTLTSHKIILNDDSSEKEIIEYYDPFEYKLKDVAGRYTRDGKEVIANVEVTYKGKEVNPFYSMVKFKYDDNNRMTGGMLYGESK